jgi:hypothetical protein
LLELSSPPSWPCSSWTNARSAWPTSFICIAWANVAI